MRAIEVEADAYFERNRHQHRPEHDPCLDVLAEVPITSALEIGSVTGWRLAGLRDRYGCCVHGVEASAQAVAEHKRQHVDIPVTHGVAPQALRDLPDAGFDLIVCGFMLYLLPRRLLFALAAEVDRLLTVNGHLLIEDFLSPTSMSRDYTHNDALRVYKHQASDPWTWAPTYCLTDRRLVKHHAHTVDNSNPDRWIAIDLVRKLADDHGWPHR